MTSESHPSYAIIRVSHPSGGDGRLFGSPLLHDHRVSIEICEASIERSHSEDRFFAKNQPMIRVEMSAEQYARFVAGGHTHSGVPCTLRRFDGQIVESPPIQARVDLHYEEARAKAAEALEALDQLQARLDVLLERLPNKSKSEIRGAIRLARGRLADHLPHVVSMMHEHMTKVVEQAKVEVEAFVRRQAGALAEGSRSAMTLSTGGND